MSPALSDDARAFGHEYKELLGHLADAAELAAELVRQVLADAGVTTHVVTARAKQPDSLWKKLRRKEYPSPADEVTDSVGVRVITYYRSDVDAVVAAVRNKFEIDEANSEDKRKRLDVYEFGYRSVHLVSKLSEVGLGVPDSVADRSFEIQVRSVLEHAWAEIEHEVVYKSGVNFSEDTLRQFAAIAGTLELVDSAFESFNEAVVGEVERWRSALADDANAAWTADVDAAGLIATLDIVAPGADGQGLIESGPPHIAALACEAVKTAGLTTPQAIRLAAGSPEVTQRVDEFAALAGLAPDDVSQLALCILIAATQAAFPVADFNDLLTDPLIRQSLGLPN